MSNSKEHLEVTSREQSTIVFLGLRDRLSRAVLRGLVEGDPSLVDDLEQGRNQDSIFGEKNGVEHPGTAEDAPDVGRVVILDEFLRDEEDEGPFEGESGDDFFSTVMQINPQEVSVVFGADSTVYALPRQEVLELIDQHQPEQLPPEA